MTRLSNLRDQLKLELSKSEENESVRAAEQIKALKAGHVEESPRKTRILKEREATSQAIAL